MKLIDDLLLDLVPYMDKVVICPLEDQEIKQIEANYNRELPQYYKYFLSRIGIRQDLIWGLNDQLRDFEDISEFIGSKDYFRFGHNGGEDYWLLKLDNEVDRGVYEYDYYCNYEIIDKPMTFDSLLIDAVEAVKSNYEKMDPNTQKAWCVEVSMNTGNAKFLEKELEKNLAVKLIRSPQKKEDSAEQTFENGLIEIEGVQVELKKWDQQDSSLSFNWEVPVSEMGQNSTLKKIENALQHCIFKHSIGQYGILNIDNLKKQS